MLIAVGCEHGKIAIIDLQEVISKKKDCFSVKVQPILHSPVTDLVFANEDKNIAAISDDIIRIFDVPSLQDVRQMSYPSHGAINQIVYNNNVFLTAHGDGTIAWWDTRSSPSTPSMTFQFSRDTSATSIAIGSDDILFAGNSSGNCVVIDSRNAKQIMRVPLPHSTTRSSVSCVSVSPDSSVLSITETNSTIHFFMLDGTWRNRSHHWRRMEYIPNRGSFSPDSRFFATGTSSGLVLIFDVSKDTPPIEHYCHEAMCSYVDWCNNDFILSCSDDKTVQIWEAQYQYTTNEARLEPLQLPNEPLMPRRSELPIIYNLHHFVH